MDKRKEILLMAFSYKDVFTTGYERLAVRVGNLRVMVKVGKQGRHARYATDACVCEGLICDKAMYMSASIPRAVRPALNPSRAVETEKIPDLDAEDCSSAERACSCESGAESVSVRLRGEPGPDSFGSLRGRSSARWVA